MTLSNTFKCRIRRLYDAQSGTRLKGLRDLHDGINVVAGGTEPYRKLSYPVQNIISAHQPVKKQPEVRNFL
jgi:hypothetical protein